MNCHNHPEKAAVAVCKKCGNAVCNDCLITVGGNIYCKVCVEAGSARELKEWTCIELKNHNDIGKTIMEWQRNGWRLHTHNCSVMFIRGAFTMPEIRHYLLFDRDQ